MDCIEKESRAKRFPSRLSFLGLLHTLLPVHTNELASQSHQPFLIIRRQKIHNLEHEGKML